MKRRKIRSRSWKKNARGTTIREGGKRGRREKEEKRKRKKRKGNNEDEGKLGERRKMRSRR